MESTMVRYFKKGLKPSIKAKINQDTIHLDDNKELIAKIVKAKAKIGLWSSFYVQETNHYCLQGSWLAHTTAYKVQT